MNHNSRQIKTKRLQKIGETKKPDPMKIKIKKLERQNNLIQ
jgi:hypothetical protein